MDTKDILIRNVSIEVAEQLLARAKALGLRGLVTIIHKMINDAVHEYAYVVDKGNCFSLVSAESGADIPGGTVCYKSDDEKLDARWQTEIKAREMGYLIWYPSPAKNLPPYMLRAGE